jgi:hypothetical protein
MNAGFLVISTAQIAHFLASLAAFHNAGYLLAKAPEGNSMGARRHLW